jgi:hypothetical protein
MKLVGRLLDALSSLSGALKSASEKVPEKVESRVASAASGHSIESQMQFQ